MGKKKSVVLMVIVTIVIVALLGLIIFPSIPVGVKDWNPVALQYDFGTEVNGGYYTYYYPEGVIPETEYQDVLQGLQEQVDDAETDEDRADKQEDLDSYVDSYKAYDEYKGLRFSTDEEYGIFANEEISEEFTDAFHKAVKEIANRYASREYSEYRVSVVSGYAVRVEIPKVEKYYSDVFTQFAVTDELTMTVGEETVDELKEGKEVSDLIDQFTVATKNGVSFIKVKFTKAGEEMIERVKETLTESSVTSETNTIHVKIGENDVFEIYKDSLLDNNREARVMAVDKENTDGVKIYSILLNSLLHNGVDFQFDANRIEARAFSPVYGDNTRTLLYIALGVILLAAIILPAIFMGRFGVVSAYTSLSYFVVVGLCYKYLLASVFELTLGGILTFLAGLVLINALQAYIYAAIKKEFESGKTVPSAVKGGYKKTIWTVVDIYVVLLLAALALLIGVGGVHTLAIHALVVVVTGAFCTLLWARLINYIYLSATTNQFKYFRFVREEEDDDDE